MHKKIALSLLALVISAQSVANPTLLEAAKKAVIDKNWTPVERILRQDRTADINFGPEGGTTFDLIVGAEQWHLLDLQAEEPRNNAVFSPPRAPVLFPGGGGGSFDDAAFLSDVFAATDAAQARSNAQLARIPIARAESEDALVIDEAEAQPPSTGKRNRLKKKGESSITPAKPSVKKSKFDEKRARIGTFAFQKDDDEDALTSTSDESYSGSAGEEVRRELNLEDPSFALYNALIDLRNGDWRAFLASPFITAKFKAVRTLIESCGHGQGVPATENLWHLAWEGRLIVNELERAMLNQECISCAMDRDLTYEICQDNDGEAEVLGYMGGLCYTVRFAALENLIAACKRIANELVNYGWEYDSSEFDQFVVREFQLALDEIIKAPAALRKVSKRD